MPEEIIIERTEVPLEAPDAGEPGYAPGGVPGDPQDEPDELTEAQRLQASAALIRYSLGICNAAAVGLAQTLSGGRITTELALTPAEVTTLANVWAPFCPAGSPLMLAIVTTTGILANKGVSVYAALGRSEKTDSSPDDRPEPEMEGIANGHSR